MKRYILSMKVKATGVRHQLVVTENRLASICIDLCGGGITEQMTIDAMEMQTSLLNGDPVEMQDTIWSCDEIQENLK